jgi:hypothetical protein
MNTYTYKQDSTGWDHHKEIFVIREGCTKLSDEGKVMGRIEVPIHEVLSEVEAERLVERLNACAAA